LLIWDSGISFGSGLISRVKVTQIASLYKCAGIAEVRMKVRAFITEFILLVCWISGNAGAASPSVPILHLKTEPYISGPEALEKVNSEADFKDYRTMLVGKTGFVDVPLDYEHPIKKMKVFFRIPKPLDTTKPSLLFFYGGPGGNSTGLTLEDRLADFNVIYFDQRGTGFSRPPALTDLENSQYFSSEFMARDAKMLIDSLGLKKVSLYGQSYGTVLATIFAHLFPESTTAVVLEGTVFDGTTDLWINPDRVRILNGFLQSLPNTMHTRIIQSSKGGIVPPTWFSRLAASYMRGDNFSANLRNRLDSALAGDDQSLLRDISTDIDQSWQVEDSAFWGAYMYHQITCQELSLSQHFGSGDLLFDNKGVLVPDPSDESKLICLQLLGMAERMNRTYLATSYPFFAPVTYFQGREDGNTGMTNAIRHFQAVPKGSATLVLVSKAGHGPIMNCMSIGKFDPNPPTCGNQKDQVTVLSKALLGQKLKDDDVKMLGPDWQLTSQK
jgi:proline iminopeptidase